MVGVQVSADDVGGGGCGDAGGAQPEQQLTADQQPAGAVVAHLGSHTSVDEDRPITRSHQETADGQPGHSVAGEQVLVAVRAGVVAEVSRRSPEGPISDGMDVDVTDQHWSPRGCGRRSLPQGRQWLQGAGGRVSDA